MDDYVDRPGARIAYSTDGGPGSGTPVLIANSFLASRHLEDTVGVFDWTVAGSRRIRFDARAHGESTGRAEDDDYRWSALADDLLAVADAAAADGPLDAIGESTGCGTLLWAVSRRPERFRRLVLAIPPTVRDERVQQGELYRATASLVELRGAEAWSRLVDNFPPVPLLDRGGWARARQVPIDLGVLPSVLRGAAASDLPAEDVLAGIRHETLVLAWTTDKDHPVSSAEYLGRVLPNARVVIADEPEQVRGWGGLVQEHLAG